MIKANVVQKNEFTMTLEGFCDSSIGKNAMNNFGFLGKGLSKDDFLMKSFLNYRAYCLNIIKMRG